MELLGCKRDFTQVEAAKKTESSDFANMILQHLRILVAANYGNIHTHIHTYIHTYIHANDGLRRLFDREPRDL